MTLRPWMLNGMKLMDAQGLPILCDQCPCGGVSTCESMVDAEVARLLAIVDPDTQQHVWLFQNTYTTDYQCAEWSYDSEQEQWIIVHPATGHLLVALTRGSIVTDTTGYGHRLLIYAKTLQNIQTGEMLTVGCECRVSEHDCMHGMVYLDGQDIAGELPVWSSDDPALITPSDGCRVDPCDLLKLKLMTANRWHGGTLLSEGYYDWLTTPQVWQSNNYHYQPFKMAVKWAIESDPVEPPAEPEPTVYNITFVDCECSSITTHTLQDGETCLEYSGICDTEDPCIDMMLLHNKAVDNGWTWHGEGVLVHLAKVTVNGSIVAYGDWYALREHSWSQGDYGEYVAYNKKMCCAETETGYWVMSCGCGSPDFYAKDTPVEAYWLYLDLEGVCSCPWEDGRYPDRELILTYPDVFGIIDIAWGNDNKYEYEYDTTESNPMDGTTYTSHHEGCSVCGYSYEPNQGYGGRTMYIDYRAMCFIGRALWMDGTEKIMVRVIYPHGSQGAPYYNYATHYFALPFNSFGYPYGIYDVATFTGTFFQPFVHDSDIYSETDGRRYMDGLDFKGFAYTWAAGGWYADMYINMCNPTETCDYNITTQEEAESEAGCNMSAPTPCITVNTLNDINWDKAALLTPDFSVVEHPCQVRKVTPDPEYTWFYYYCYLHKWWEMGAQLDTCRWSYLNIHYIRTNRGLIVKGLDGYQETYTLPGCKNFPDYTWCWDTPKEEQPYWDDEIVTCAMDEDMHFCIADFEVPADEDEGESE